MISDISDMYSDGITPDDVQLVPFYNKIELARWLKVTSKYVEEMDEAIDKIVRGVDDKSTVIKISDFSQQEIGIALDAVKEAVTDRGMAEQPLSRGLMVAKRILKGMVKE